LGLTRRRAVEAAVTGVAGAALGAGAGSLVKLTAPAAVVGGLNGVLAGARQIYAWRRPSGALAFALDSTWALPMTAAALVPHAVAGLQGRRAGYVAALSERADRHVYARGLRVRRGFAITIGNVVNGAGDAAGSPRRARLVTDHEHVHVWQARWLGPLYPVLYVGWTIGAGLAGAAIWAARRRHDPFVKVVETCAYYLNPFEWWAYSRDDQWPPAGAVAGLGWRRPVVRPFSRYAGRSG
jgi:hypothetical protein